MMQRKTKQREAILEAFQQAGRPLSPQEALEFAKEALPSLGIATVYRTINSFTDEGMLTAVNIPGEAPRYELKGLPHHHHFLCRNCKRSFDIEGCPGPLKDMAPDGFRVESHDLTLIGLCPDCSSEKK